MINKKRNLKLNLKSLKNKVRMPNKIKRNSLYKTKKNLQMKVVIVLKPKLQKDYKKT